MLVIELNQRISYYVYFYVGIEQNLQKLHTLSKKENYSKSLKVKQKWTHKNVFYKVSTRKRHKLKMAYSTCIYETQRVYGFSRSLVKKLFLIA